jgi:solute carrier family 25 (mitochondrial thiamine pyrophosphate transporter), member 19
MSPEFLKILILAMFFKFATFEALHRSLWSLRLTDDPKNPVAYFFCGSMAGMAATVAAQPLDVIRTRFVSQGPQKVLQYI